MVDDRLRGQPDFPLALAFALARILAGALDGDVAGEVRSIDTVDRPVGTEVRHKVLVVDDAVVLDRRRPDVRLTCSRWWQVAITRRLVGDVILRRHDLYFGHLLTQDPLGVLWASDPSRDPGLRIEPSRRLTWRLPTRHLP